MISDYGSTERVATDHATPDIIRETMNSLDWQRFHQVVLDRPDGDWLEVGGSLDPVDGFCVTYEENGKQHFMVPPTTVEEMTGTLLQYLDAVADWQD